MRSIFTSLLLLCILSACGGGGGSSDSMPPVGNQPPSSSQTAFAGTRTINRDVLTQHIQALLDATRQSHSPVFGSVMQAYTSRTSGPSAVETSFNGSRFTLRIRRGDGSVSTLDTSQDLAEATRTYAPSENPVTARPAVDGYLYRSNTSEVMAASVSVEWSNTDFTDYVAGGYWAHIDLGTQNAAVSAETGAFIDGPDYRSAVDVPATGTATYNGRAGGGYLLSCGSVCEFPAGTRLQGQYAGDLTLVASFGDQSISGSIRNIDLYARTYFTPEGTAAQPSDILASGYGLTLGPAPIRQNGQFVGSSVTLTHPTVDISSSGGSWAGRFSTVDDSSGNPRAVIGTHQGSATYTGGSRTVFIGTHYGATGRFQ